jgi:hypothetical protein
VVTKRANIILIFLVLTGCEEKRPPGVLSRQEMVNVLIEVYVAENNVNRLGLRSDSASKVFDAMRGKVFERANVPDSVFKKSMDYYVDRPKQLELIYTALVDSLHLREQRSPNHAEQ